MSRFQAKVDRLSHHHRTLFHFCRVDRYLRVIYQLARNSQRCLRDVKDLRVDLEQEVRALQKKSTEFRLNVTQIRALDRAAVTIQREVNDGPAALPNVSLPVSNSIDTV